MDFSTAPLRSRLQPRSWISLPKRVFLSFVGWIRAHKFMTGVIVVLCFLFYWSQLRPIVIARQCARQASFDARQLITSKSQLAKDKETRDSYAALAAKNMYLRTDYDSFLQKCMLHYGFQVESLQRASNTQGSENSK